MMSRLFGCIQRMIGPALEETVAPSMTKETGVSFLGSSGHRTWCGGAGLHPSCLSYLYNDGAYKPRIPYTPVAVNEDPTDG